MSERLISLSPDLRRLVDEGYVIQVNSGHLVVQEVPYLKAGGEVGRGELIAPATWAGDICAKPKDHVAWFHGEKPHRADGRPLKHIIAEGRRESAKGVTVDFQMSSKPPAGFYPDFYEKVATYVALLEGPAQSVDPSGDSANLRPPPPCRGRPRLQLLGRRSRACRCLRGEREVPRTAGGDHWRRRNWRVRPGPSCKVPGVRDPSL